MVLGYYFPNAFSKFLYSRLIKSTTMSFVFKVPGGGGGEGWFSLQSSQSWGCQSGVSWAELILPNNHSTGKKKIKFSDLPQTNHRID